jgi:hypothetical protein
VIAVVPLLVFVVVALLALWFGADSRPGPRDRQQWQWPFHDPRL